MLENFDQMGYVAWYPLNVRVAMQTSTSGQLHNRPVLRDSFKDEDVGKIQIIPKAESRRRYAMERNLDLPFDTGLGVSPMDTSNPEAEKGKGRGTGAHD